MNLPVVSGAVLHARHFLAEFAFIGFGNLMANELCFRVWMLAFGEPGKMLIADRTFQAPLLGQFPLPLAMPLLVAAPIVLPLRSKLPLMVRPYL